MWQIRIVQWFQTSWPISLGQDQLLVEIEKEAVPSSVHSILRSAYVATEEK